MIASIEGKIASQTKDSLIVIVQGIGYEVFVPDTTRIQSHIGDPLLLHTTLIVREDSMTLYGFKTLAEKEIFEVVTSVSGIGPRLGLAILSTMSIEQLRSAIVSERDEVLTRVPGIGKKTAKKIVFELRDKLITRDAIPADLEFDLSSNINADVIDGLTGLGFSVVEAQKAVQSLPPDAPDSLEDRLSLALQILSK